SPRRWPRCAPGPPPRPRAAAPDAYNAHPPSAPRDRRNDADRLAGLHLRREPSEEADVLLADVDVHETAHPLRIEQALLEPRMPSLQVLDDLSDRVAVGLDLVGAAGERAQRRRNPNDGAHEPSSFVYRD